jgi:hypothetical protein
MTAAIIASAVIRISFGSIRLLCLKRTMLAAEHWLIHGRVSGELLGGRATSCAKRPEQGA